MYRQQLPTKGNVKTNKSYKGEMLIHKIQRITSNKEPISDNAPLVYTDRKDGVLPDYDIRTDRWEAAIDATDAIAKSHEAKREMKIGEKTYDTMSGEQQAEFNKKYPKNKHAQAAAKAKETGGQSTQGTGNA